MTLQLPAVFIERCRQDGVTPEDVLRGFIADLCDSDAGSDVCFLAQEYYALAGDTRRRGFA